MKSMTCALGALIATVSLASEVSPYAGQEQRSITSYSEQEIASLRAGDGMGFAKLAELNRYPGPKHVLELSDQLDLTSAQISATQALFDQMKSDAVTLGNALLDAEASLDRQFESGAIDADSLEESLLQIGRIRAQLRYVHLEAHLRQTALLTEAQVERYVEARGYDRSGHQGHEHSGSRH